MERLRETGTVVLAEQAMLPRITQIRVDEQRRAPELRESNGELRAQLRTALRGTGAHHRKGCRMASVVPRQQKARSQRSNRFTARMPRLVRHE